jgi:Cu(I)/Ag(I) efflux system protein CusF
MNPCPIGHRPPPATALAHAFACIAAVALAGPAHAQATDGELRRIDRAQAKLTIKHGEIRNLDMPAMTMVFRVADPKLLEGLTEGDKVRFDAEKVNGQYTVLRITAVR